MAESQTGWYKENYEGTSTQSPKWGWGRGLTLLPVLFTHRKDRSVHHILPHLSFLDTFLQDLKGTGFFSILFLSRMLM